MDNFLSIQNLLKIINPIHICVKNLIYVKRIYAILLLSARRAMWSTVLVFTEWENDWDFANHVTSANHITSSTVMMLTLWHNGIMATCVFSLQMTEQTSKLNIREIICTYQVLKPSKCRCDIVFTRNTMISCNIGLRNSDQSPAMVTICSWHTNSCLQ